MIARYPVCCISLMIRHLHRSSHTWLGCILLAVCTSGCIVLPVPTSEKKVLRGSPISDQVTKTITIGVTTSREITQELGQPHVIWSDHRIWAYDWDVRKMLVVWIIGGGYQGAIGGFDVPRRYVLLVQFDEQDRVQRIGKTIRHNSADYGSRLIEWLSQTGRSTNTIPSDERVLDPPAVVLLQIVPQGKEINKALHHWLWGQQDIFRVIGSGVGTFATGGMPRAQSLKKVSAPSGYAGWYKLQLPPGANYLGLAPNAHALQENNYALIFRVDVPANTPVVYAGSLHLPISYDPKGGILSGASFTSAEAKIVCASPEAEAVAASLSSPLEKPVTSLMRIHQGPFIIGRGPFDDNTSKNQSD